MMKLASAVAVTSATDAHEPITVSQSTPAIEDDAVMLSVRGATVQLAADKVESEGTFATVPVKFVVIEKHDGTGRLSQASLESRMVALNKMFNGDDPDAVSEDEARAMNLVAQSPESCGKKCDVALCYEDGKYKDIVDITSCFCGDNYCKDWSSLGKMHGSRANAGIGFTLQGVSHVINDAWHDQCCCSHAGGLSYEPKMLEIQDALIDKTTVRSVVTIIVCNMKSTMGQSVITGSPGCEGGPSIFLTHTFDDHTLAHEFGHYFGLYHTFQDNCPNNDFGACEPNEVCDESTNLGDGIADTPVHKKQGMCAGAWDVDSCPGGGADPLDNLMSYSGCELSRLTPGQVAKMRQTITDYYPAFLTTGGGDAKDLPCNPGFPSLGEATPAGYAPPAAAASATPTAAAPVDQADGAVQTACPLSAGQCDRHDTTGCYCTDASKCCRDHGCGGMEGMRQCLPCEWKSWGTEFTADSCE